MDAQRRYLGLLQTAQSAEPCASAGAMRLLDGPSRLFGRSRNFVAHAQRHPAEVCRHSRLHAATSKVAFLLLGVARIVDMGQGAPGPRHPKATLGTVSLQSATTTPTPLQWLRRPAFATRALTSGESYSLHTKR